MRIQRSPQKNDISIQSGGKGVITVSQVATGEENNLRIKVYASEDAVLWEQENPNYLGVYRYDKRRQTWTRAADYVSEHTATVTRIPTGHPEGYLEAFANIYLDVVQAIRRYIDGDPLDPEKYAFPTVYDGLRGMQFINSAVQRAKNGAVWVDLK